MLAFKFAQGFAIVGPELYIGFADLIVNQAGGGGDQAAATGFDDRACDAGLDAADELLPQGIVI